MYEKGLVKNSLYDYEDMLLETSEALRKHKKLLRDLQENYLYILADEHQDANGNQNKILEELASYDDNPNLFIVGDEKQAIYRFQGASLENFLYFKNKFPKSKIITLIKNYRSTQEILDASHQLSLSMDNGGKIKRERLLSNSKKGTPVSIICFNHEDDELDFVTLKAIEISKNKNVAILYRDNNDVLEIGRRFRKRKADFSIKSDENILGDDNIKNFINFIKTINDPTDNENLSRTLFLDFLDLPLISSLKLIKSNKYSSNIINSLSEDLSKIGINEADNKQLKNFYEKLKTWSLRAKNESLLDFLDVVFEESGFKSKLLKSNNPIEKIEKFRSFYAIARASSESKNSARLSDFIRDLELFETFNLNASDLVYEHEGRKIVLMTAHKSKGLEFDVVFIVKANEEKWAGKNKKEYFILPLQKDDSKENRNMDERRLFYVAMTRGKEKVIITYSEKDYKGKILSKSSFIDNIDESLITIEKGQVNPIYFIDEPKDDKSKIRKDFKDYVSSTLSNEGLNVTALNNYLNCPWKYFFQNLIKIPHKEEKHQQFGTAIHYALKMSAEDLNSGIKPSLSKAIKYFSTEISKMDFSKEELIDWKQRGERALQSFFKGHTWAKDIKAEFKISSIPFSSSLGGIMLRGNIDQLINKTNGNFSVVDFKTGNTKTRNEILGNTKNSNGDIFRQLLFYKLLLETYFNDKKVEDGIIEFVEPDNKGRFKQENFDLKFEKLDNLKKEIDVLITEVTSLGFIENKCGDRECEFCSMGEILKQKIPSK
jgi:DNA helicase-2/ATP-dependent DNA helicase PcrA